MVDEKEEKMGVEESTETDSELEAGKDEYAPTKKVVRRRKSKKEKENPLSAAIRLAVESGKVEFGSNIGLKNAAVGKAKLFVVAGNVSGVMEKFKALKSEVPTIEFEGSSIDLGSICGKPFPISILSIYEQGSSNILDLVKKKAK
ncbi:MAG: 50S ribosomal protein L30e [Candidatus Micrarchaeota archaeon]|nr:50S ribosomal protein L30e [Candidatus Micrarchaeota archaeon]